MINYLINSELSKSKQYIINIVASILNMLVATLISFFLSPYIVKNIGVEANGFVALANNFISYATLARTAINSMGSRYIVLAYYNKEYEKVEKYYSSIFFADLLLGVFLGIISAICVWKLEYVLNVPENLISDVKLLFSVLFINFIIATIITVWNTATYVKNKLYLDSIASVCGSVIRATTILGLFMCLQPSVSIVGIGTLVGGLISYVFHYIYKKNIFPDLNAKISNFSWKAIKNLISSGIWNTISTLGVILTSSVDLLVANLFVGATEMGVLAVAKVMPGFVDNLNYTIASTFAPSLMIDYAQGKKENILDTINKSSKIISVICSLPLGFLIVYGAEFYSLWQPSQEAKVLHILSVITISGRVFFTGMQPLFDVFTVVNKVKQNSIVIIVNGIISITLTCILLTTTNLGIYAIAGVSVVCCFLKNIFFVIPFSAKYLNLKWTTFYCTLIPSVLSCFILCIWGWIQKFLMPVQGWMSLIISGMVFVVIGLILTVLLVLNKVEREYLLKRLNNKMKNK